MRKSVLNRDLWALGLEYEKVHNLIYFLFAKHVFTCGGAHTFMPQWPCEMTTIRSYFSCIEAGFLLLLLLCYSALQATWLWFCLNIVISEGSTSEKKENTHTKQPYRPRQRVGIWSGAQPSWESLTCGLCLCRFQVTGQLEDNACALITRKGIFSEKCFIDHHWICQDSSTEDSVWMITAISPARKESDTMEICIFSQKRSHYVAVAVLELM